MREPVELATWRRIRRYAVPPSMIAEATAARLAGDWRAACAAARVDVDIDLARFAPAVAAALEDDLVHFAPDLLRWHLPRHLGGHTVISPRRHVVLTPSAGGMSVRFLVRLPTVVTASQRLHLSVVGAREDLSYFDAPPYTWDARRAGELRTAWGGADDRPPLLTPTAEPVPLDRLGEGMDDAARTERVLALRAGGDVVEAWRLAGVDLDPSPPARVEPERALTVLARYPLWPVGLAAEVGRVCAAHRLDEVYLPAWPVLVALRPRPDGSAAARLIHNNWTLHRGRPIVGEPVWRQPPDLDLLWRGLMRPDELHPLVHASLFPSLPPPAPPAAPEPAAPEPVRVRCRGGWHRLRVVDGRIRALDHAVAEEQAEQTLHAMGGRSTGCFAVQQAWTEGRGWLPRGLREQRADLMQHVIHGDTEYVQRLLDAGYLDVRMRDSQAWTLLHMLLFLDHEKLLPRLLDAGLPIDVRESRGRTPLHVMVGNDGPRAVARALFEAGADPSAADEYDGTIAHQLEYRNLPGFGFLLEEDGA